MRPRETWTAVAVYLAYVAGLTLVVGVLALAVATASSTLVDRLRTILPLVNRLSGIVLVLVGANAGYYGQYEVRLSGSKAVRSADGVIAFAGRLQGSLAGWILRHGAWPWCVAVMVLVTGVVIAEFVRRARR